MNIKSLRYQFITSNHNVFGVISGNSIVCDGDFSKIDGFAMDFKNAKVISGNVISGCTTAIRF